MASVGRLGRWAVGTCHETCAEKATTMERSRPRGRHETGTGRQAADAGLQRHTHHRPGRPRPAATTGPETLHGGAGHQACERSQRAPGSRARADWALIVPPAVTLAVMSWGITAPSYWRDEAATLPAVSRSLPQLLRLLGRVDAVHGLYYLLLWPVTQVAGTGDLVTRLPSARRARPHH
jgi:hypothetical protein